MCVLAFAWQCHDDFPLIFAGNRDEFHDRPADPAHWWPDAPDLFAGRDQKAGGTWLGVTRSGRIATVTNFRHPDEMKATSARSRGLLVTDLLLSDEPLEVTLAAIDDDSGDLAGFNLIAGQGDALWYLGNRAEPSMQPVEAGVHGLSNAVLDTPWPKVEALKNAVGEQAATAEPSVDALMAALSTRVQPDDSALPDTGVGIDMERFVAPAFISSAHYGTRASTVILVGRDDSVRVVERRFGPDGRFDGATEERFRITG